MQYTPKIDLGADRFKLHRGPYKTPRFRIDQTVIDAIRGAVTIVGVTDGLIPWPIGKTKRAKTLVMFRGLANALRNESNTAICHWWGVTDQTVTKWRNALGISYYMTGLSPRKSRTIVWRLAKSSFLRTNA